MKNNKGFTLIELIVVIAIMAVVSGVSSSILKTVSQQELKDFTNNLDAMLCQCKVETMSGMPDPALEISLRNGEYKATLYKNSSTRPEVVKSQYLGEDTLTCIYVRDGREINYNGRGTITFKYDRNTGELKNKSITKISVSLKKGTYAIELVPETGYHKIVK